MLLWAAACGNPPNPAPETTPNALVTPTNDRPVLLLERLYATATRPGSEIAALFDDKADTYWETRRGAGPDEGIMLVFQRPVLLAALQVMAGPGSFHSTGARLQIYLNGSPLPPFAPDQKVQLPEQAVDSLFIRFISTGKETISDVVVNDGKIEVQSYPPDASIRINTIRIWNEQNVEMRLSAPRWSTAEVKTRSMTPPLATIVDRRIYNRIDAAYPVIQSLILRSDGTFSMYRFTEETGDRMEATGTWETDTSGLQNGVATISLSGKWRNVASVTIPEKGGTQDFREVATVMKDRVAGGKVTGVFWVNPT